MRFKAILVSVCLFLAGLTPTGSVAAQPTGPTYLDPSAPVELRVRDLLGRMTIEEKAGQMTQIDVARLVGDGHEPRGVLNPDALQEAFDHYQVGSILSAGGGGPLRNTPGEWASLSNELQHYAMDKSRLHIPIIYGID